MSPILLRMPNFFPPIALLFLKEFEGFVRVEYEALLEELKDLRDISDSLETLKEYKEGQSITFDEYDTRRKRLNVQD